MDEKAKKIKKTKKTNKTKEIKKTVKEDKQNKKSKANTRLPPSGGWFASQSPPFDSHGNPLKVEMRMVYWQP